MNPPRRDHRIDLEGFTDSPVEDLDQIARARRDVYGRSQWLLPLQPAENAAGLTQADIEVQVRE